MRSFRLVLILIPLLLVVLTACDQQPPQTDEETTGAENSEVIERDFPEKMEISSLDSLPISAHLYYYSDEAPTLLLCHQARFNKFEYDGIAPKLHRMGFNCLAIDQRSGGPIASQVNETTVAARELGEPTDFLDAEQDIVAAMQWAYETWGKPVYLWGSSYSSTLVLYIVAEHEEAAGAISFSPGNYLADDKGSLVPILKDVEKPLFLTSSKNEAPEVTNLIKGKTLNEMQVQFIPEGNGHHGSRALWETQEGGEEYWSAIKDFLKKIHPYLQE